MATTPLRATGWSYDDETGLVTVTLIETAPLNHPDPAGFIAERFFAVVLRPDNAPTETRRPRTLDNPR